MPAHVCVTAAQVAAAVAVLQDAEEPVTGWRLRRVIGVGDPKRLEALAREMMSQHGLQPAAHEFSLPSGISDSVREISDSLGSGIRQAVDLIWSEACTVSSRRIAAEVEAARSRVAVLEDELVQAEKAIEADDTLVEQLQQQIDTAHNRFREEEAMRKLCEREMVGSLGCLNLVRGNLRDIEIRANALAVKNAELRTGNAEAERKVEAALAARDVAVAEARTLRDRAVAAEQVARERQSTIQRLSRMGRIIDVEPGIDDEDDAVFPPLPPEPTGGLSAGSFG